METAESANIWQIVNELQDDPEVEYAEPVFLGEIEAEPNDALYSLQHYLPQILAPEAWDIGYGDSTVIVGIIDTGVDWDHEDLVDVIWSNEDEVLDGTDTDGNGYVDDIRGWDFVRDVSDIVWPGEDGEDQDNDPMDFDGHGTGVSGVVAAQTNNNLGVASVASGARIMPLRCGLHTSDGGGIVPSEWCAEAYIYAADNGAHITNQSSQNHGQLIVDAALYATRNGVLVIESAGNSDLEPEPSALGSQSWVMSVAAVNKFDQIAFYSGAGEFVDISAPGGEWQVINDPNNGLLNTALYPSDFYGGERYYNWQGTSFAAPLTASVAALVKSHNPGMTVVDLFSRIVGTADDIDGLNPGFEGLLGSGRVNVYRALTEEVHAEPEFTIVKSEILEDEGGNGNGKLDPGEDATLRLTLKNWQEASGITAILGADSEWPITISSGVATPEDLSVVSETEIDFQISCALDALPRAVNLNLDISGSGFNESVPFQISISPQVLVIADFEGGSGSYLDFTEFYIAALNASNISFDYIHHADAEISYDFLNNYQIVIWGCEWSFPSLDVTDRAALEQFLDNGGSLFLSGQDIGWDLNESDDNIDVSFFNDYLKSTYLADNAGTNLISGIEEDPISDGLELSFYQKRRASTQQFPDIIEPRETAQSTLNYNASSSGGITYSGDYRLVFFSFAGFEAIDVRDDREIIMARVIDFLDGIDIDHEPMKDTEDTEGDYTFKLSATADNDTISNVELHWSTDGVLPYTVVTMADSGNNTYEASIAALEGGMTVNYFIYVETESATYAFSEEFSFNIGPDMVAPTLELTNPYITSTINVNGPAPYEFIFKIDDNLGIDTTSARLFFSVNEGSLDSTALSHFEKDKFTGTFSFEEALLIGDEISYYAQVVDRSVNQNLGKTDTYTITIDTFQVIDDFEDGDWRWDLGLGWGIDDSDQNSGEFSIADSPDGASYEDNAKNSLTFGFPFNLSNFLFAQLDFYLKAALIPGDSLFVEVSTDYGETWNSVWYFARSSFSFRLQSIDLSAFTGEGMDDVQIRFTLSSDDEGVGNGVSIDDISIIVSELPLAIEDSDITLPLTYDLKQNYPNPFNPSTTIQYSIPKTEQVELIIYTITGEKVKTMVSDKVEAGHHSIQWNGDNDQGRSVASGVYIYRIKTKGFTRSMKMLFLK
jgi:hypothetical protein